MNTSLGLLEVVGLALAIKAADTMAKAANITITGIERAKGSGWMLITITGDVAAVASALANGAELARRENGWVADRTIARPADALAPWFKLSSPAAALSGAAVVIDPAAAAEPSAKPSDASALCNLCHDPACPRRKGEPRAGCMHDGKRGSV